VVERTRAAEVGGAVIPRWVVAVVMPVVATVVFWIALPPAYRVSESSDYEGFYRPVALQILAGHGLARADGIAAVRYPPGYPVLLAGVIGAGNALGVPEDIALDALTFVCIALSSLFLYLIARDVWDGWLALLPSAVWSTYPLALWLTKQPNSEVPFTLLLFACVFAAWKLTRWAKPSVWLAVAAGVLAGAAMLVRPIAVLLPFVMVVIVWLLSAEWPRRARLAAAAAIIVASWIIVAPWEIWATRTAGHFVMVSTAGASALRDGLTFGVNPTKDYRRGIYVPDAVRTVMIDFYAQYDSLDSYSAVMRSGARELGRHPVGTVGLVGMKLARAWYGTDSQRLDRYLALAQLMYVALLAWATWIAWHARGERRRLVIIITWVVVYFWVMTVVALPLVRYMVPAIGLAFLLIPVIAEPQRRRHA
jgi:4-amino-4-deoxy-L-arabinose transferase-like glycosyltransferase